MGLLKKIFKKKPGGTFFGNLIRAGVSKVSGGILGSGANRLPLVEGAQQQQTNQNIQENASQSALAQTLSGLLQGATKDVTVKGGVDNKTIMVVGGVAVVGVLIALLMKK
ncbi:MAG: structural protein [Bacteriophage sp.]|nr:MAG: structural protein [Bacteriophage sp.]